MSYVVGTARAVEDLSGVLIRLHDREHHGRLATCGATTCRELMAVARRLHAADNLLDKLTASVRLTKRPEARP